MTEEILPVTGEYLQSLCDYSVISEQIKSETPCKYLDALVPPERQLFIGTEWPSDSGAKSVFLYPGKPLLEAFLQHEWPALRLLVYHNGDNPIEYSLLLPFLEANPFVHAWVLNNTEEHPRIRTVPIFEENRAWRGGNATYDPPVKLCRSAEREYALIYPWCSYTHPSRPTWYEEAKKLRRPDMMVFARLPKEDYHEALESTRAVVCPPGNGVDTHRCWETLYKGAWAIVYDSAHTRCLLKEYPSLPLIPIKDTAELETLTPPPCPSPFHPILTREFWKVLFTATAGGT